MEVASLAASRGEAAAIRIEARRLAASTAFQSLDDERVGDARLAFQEMTVGAEQVEGMARYWVTSNVLRDWATSEAMLGNCAEATRVLALYDTAFDHPGAAGIARDGRATTQWLMRERGFCR